MFIEPAFFFANRIEGRAMAGIFPPAAMALIRWGLFALFFRVVLFLQIKRHAKDIRA